jgi:hypothetical protein
LDKIWEEDERDVDMDECAAGVEKWMEPEALDEVKMVDDRTVVFGTGAGSVHAGYVLVLASGVGCL